jgi:predicted RNase H-like HicB family nuclease
MRRYLIVIEKAEGNYSAYSPDLPGCVGAGDTVEETKRLMLEAIELHIKGLQEDGLPVPEPETIGEYVTV